MADYKIDFDGLDEIELESFSNKGTTEFSIVVNGDAPQVTTLLKWTSDGHPIPAATIQGGGITLVLTDVYITSATFSDGGGTQLLALDLSAASSRYA